MRKKTRRRCLSLILSAILLLSTVLNMSYVAKGSTDRNVISGDLTVTTFFSEKTDAMELQSGDEIQFDFVNTSTGTNNWENFVFAIIGTDMENYSGGADEILIIRADNWGWGGGMADFAAPFSGTENDLNFVCDIDWDLFAPMMQAGAECQIVVAREGNTIDYQAKIGDYTVSCVATSGVELPETCYMFFTGENCILSDITTTILSEDGEPIPEGYVSVADMPDKNLFAAALNCGDEDGDGLLSYAEAAHMTYLEIYYGVSVEDYTGLELLANLEYLNYYGEAASADLINLFTALKYMPDIKYVYLPNSELDSESFSILADIGLYDLTISSGEDISFLSDEAMEGKAIYESLYRLTINTESDLSMQAIAGFKNLQHLSVAVNGEAAVNDFDALAGLENLSNISLSGCLSDVDFSLLKDMKLNNIELHHYYSEEDAPQISTEWLSNATNVYLSGVTLSDSISHFSKELYRLCLYNCNLAEEDKQLDLSEFVCLGDLSIEYCGIEEVNGLENAEGLYWVNLTGNELTKVPDFAADNYIYYLNLNGNNITDISNMVNNLGLCNFLLNLYLWDNEITKLPDMSSFINLMELDVSSNAIEELENANLDKCEYLDYLTLSGNKLTKDEVVGFVPVKFSGDVGWLSDATSINVDGHTIKTYIDSEVIAYDIEDALWWYDEIPDTIYLGQYLTNCEEVVIEEELLEYVRGLGTDVYMMLTYVDVNEEEDTTGVWIYTEVDFSRIPEDITEFTLQLKAPVMASDEVKEILGTDKVYTTFSYDQGIDGVSTYTNMSVGNYNIYEIEDGEAVLVMPLVADEEIGEYIKQGIISETDTYYVPFCYDPNFVVTDEEGKFSAPEEYDMYTIEYESILKFVENAEEGSKIAFAIAPYMNVRDDIWNAIIDKKLQADVSVVGWDNTVKSILHLSYDKMEPFKAGEVVYDGYLLFDSLVFKGDIEDKGVNVWFISDRYWSDGRVYEDYTQHYEWIEQNCTYDVSIYVGKYLKNGEKVTAAEEKCIINDKMEKQWVNVPLGKEYTVEKGMIRLECKPGTLNRFMSESDFEDYTEAEIPAYDSSVIYEDKEVVLEAEGQVIKNLRVDQLKNNYTIVSEITFDDEFTGDRVPLFALDNRDAYSMDVYVDVWNNTLAFDLYNGEYFAYHYMGEIESIGTHTLTMNFYTKDGETWLQGFWDNVKMYDQKIDYEIYKTFNALYNYDYSLIQGIYDLEWADDLDNIKTTVYAGSVLPDGIVDKPGITLPTEAIEGDLLVDNFFINKTGAVKLESGDSYTFKFTNTSLGTNNWDNFIMAITATAGYEYFGYQDEILIIRADNWGWGGARTDFSVPFSGGANELVFTTDMVWEEFVAMMQEGAECEVKITRLNNTLIYNAKIGDYTVSCEATSGYSLPKTCYIFFTGENCQLTGFTTEYEEVKVEDTLTDSVTTEADRIEGDLIVNNFFYEKSNAMKLEDGDKYTFTFTNKSNGESNWENYIMVITDAIGYDYAGWENEKLVIRADSWGWGGENGEFVAPDSEEGNKLVFETDIIWEEFMSMMTAGAECEVTVSRNGNTLSYYAKIGDKYVSCEATSEKELPETLYVFFTGENCDLVGMSTYIWGVDDVEEPTTEEPTTEEPTTEEPTTEEPTTEEPTTEEPTTEEPTTEEPTTEEPTTEEPTTEEPTTEEPTTEEPTTAEKPSEYTKEEGKNSAPVEVKENIIVEADKVITTAVEKMQETIKKTVEVVSTVAQTINKEVLETVQSEGKNLTLGVTDDNNQLQYSWTFSNKVIENTDMEIDLGITFDTEKKEEIEELTGRTDALYVNFAHHGELPGPTTIKMYVGDQYKNGDVVYLYYFNEEVGKVLLVGEKPLTVKGGYVEYTITHCSVYFVIEEKLENIELDDTSLKDASISLIEEEDEDDVVTADGNNTALYIIMMLAIISLGMVVFIRLKKEKI